MDIVTGSFGYIGKYITDELLRQGRQVRTITTHPNKPNPFGEQVMSFPYNFEQSEKLVETLRGADVLFNTYWVRFNYRGWSFDQALENTRTLFKCAKEAGIRKIVHISVTNPTETDALPYYRGKAQQEKQLKETGIPYTILRPTLVYGKEDILVNNIAWTVRKFPFVPIFGDGKYRLQPVFVADLARLSANSLHAYDGLILDVAGAEKFTYRGLIEAIASALGRRLRLVRVSPDMGIFLGRIIGLFMRDVLLTRDELSGLMQEKLLSLQEPLGKTRFSEWLVENKDELGKRYTSELGRHFWWKNGAKR